MMVSAPSRSRRLWHARSASQDPGSPGPGRDGPALPGRRRRVTRLAAHHAALPHDARGVGAAEREGRRHRDALRSAAPAGRNSLMRVTVLTGGATAERAVAFASASQIVAALRSRKHDVKVVDTAGGQLDERGEREVLGGAVGLTPPAVDALGWPVIVKPSKQGSSVGLTLVKKAQDLDNAVKLAGHYDDEVMAEQFIPGRELTVGVLGDVPLPVGEIVPKHELFDYETKYTPGMSEETFPARIETLLARQLQEYAVMAHRALKLNGYSRVDFRVTPEGDIFCLEANSLPGMTRTSLYPQAAQAAGIPFPELCERVARLARNNRTGRGG